MKKNKLLILGIAAAAVYFLFIRKPVSGDQPAKNLLANLVDQLDESADYKTYFKSRIAEMTKEEAESLVLFLQSGIQNNLQIATYSKYQLGS